MRQFLVVIFVFTLFVASPSLVLGQDTEQNPIAGAKKELITSQFEELERWIEAYTKHQKWYKRFGNQVRVNYRHRPDPPDWLEAECVDLIGGEGILVNACALLHEIEEGEQLTRIRKDIAAQRSQNDAWIKTQIYERAQIGFGWPVINQYQSVKYGAIFAFHLSVMSVGRFEANLPGIMILTIPNMKGERVSRYAIHYGASLKLNTFTMPGNGKKYLTHLNFSNAKVMDGFSGFAEQKPLSLVGFSFSLVR